MKKYLDLAEKERIVIQRGKRETFVLTKEEFIETDEDFENALTSEQFQKGAKEHIAKLFAQDRK